MPVDFHDKDALVTAATLNAGKPIAFLVGSPLSTKDGVGVPDVEKMLVLARNEINRQAPRRLGNFEESIRAKSGSEAYQAAMTWLNGNLLQDGVNRVVHAAVRMARKDGGHDNFKCDGSHGDWHIAPGTLQLATLICRDPERFTGPILTTNFDPLLSLAIEACGAKPHLRVIQADGGLGQDVKRTGETEVIHLHGFWRDSDTLHGPAQLTAPRLRLKDSLKDILRQKTLIVAAYGGWDDIFATALAEVASDDAAQVNILWCFRDSDPAKIERDYQKLFQRVQPAITRGRFVAYRGVDCHTIFGEIGAALPSTTASPISVVADGLSPFVGWQVIEGSFLSGLPPLTNEETIRYFDGASPTWRHAISLSIPRRQDVGKLTTRLAQLAHDNVARSMHLIRAAGGEGKSTLLLQVAADAVRAGGWTVLWRTSPKAGISPEQVATLDPARRWLIIADDADNIVPGLADSAWKLSEINRQGVHFLLAARDADWKNARGPWQSWAEWLDHFTDIVLRGITSYDAKVVLAAWENAGPDGLRELAAIHTPAQRITAFENAVKDALNKQEEQARRHRLQEGSFFGGLLAVRFGQNGLRSHVRAFLRRLNAIPIEHGKGNLFDALLYVAACHGTGIPGINERILADLTGVPREWVQRYIVRPLGEEACAVQTAGHVLTRHSHVAAAILVEAEENFETDLAEVWAHLIRQTVKVGREPGCRIGETYGPIVHSGPKLHRTLPNQIPNDRRRDIAIAAAKAFVQAASDRMSGIVDLGKTYRNAQMIEQAIATFRDNLHDVEGKVDSDSDLRAFWYEWSICEGARGTAIEHALSNAWLGGLAISDHLGSVRMTPDDGMLICSGVAVAFGKLAQFKAALAFAKARRAAVYVGRNSGHNPITKRYFDFHDREADKLKTPYPRDITEALAWFATGVIQAGHEIRDPLLRQLVNPDKVSFDHLRVFLGAPRVAMSPAPNSAPAASAQSTPPNNAPAPQPTSLTESRIQAGIERVMAEAWGAVPLDTPPEDCFRLAKHQALQSISRLSPHIKRQVGAYFHTQNWEPLKIFPPPKEKSGPSA